jgi:ubiquinone/menaquinone biosynthesis C-methylase UbiE
VDHADHVALLEGGVAQDEGGIWADLGAGTGAFTLALADLLGPHGLIHAIDSDRAALAELRSAFVSSTPHAEVRTRHADFTRVLDLAELDGIVMANSLHFVEDKAPVLAQIRGYLKARGRLVVVEYESDRGNEWVPYPMRFATWSRIATDAGFTDTRKLAEVPSRFLGAIYSALSLAP